MGKRYALGFDIGGTKVEASLIDSDGEIIETLRYPAPKENGAMLDLIVDMANRVIGSQDIEGIGFSIPGRLDPITGLLRNAPHSPAIENSALATDLSARLPYRLAFENDANCLVSSEVMFGAARGYRHVVGIILGTGVGGGVIIDGQLLHGARGLAPEIGHMLLDINGRICGCGNQGCIEAYLSGPSVLARFHDAGGEAGVQDTKSLYQLRSSNTLAAQIIEDTEYYFVRMIGVLMSMYDPEAFVLGGGLSLQDRFYELSDEISKVCFGTDQAPPILRAEGGDSSGKLGAAALILRLTGVPFQEDE